MSSLDRIEVSGYKSIRHMDLSLSALNFLIGANGAGKTNFISVFKLLSAIVEGRLQEFVASSGGANSILHFGRKATDELKIFLEFGENQYSVSLRVDPSDQFFLADESAFVWDRTNYPRPHKEFLGANHRESTLKSDKRAVAKYVYKKVSSWRLYHFHDTSDSARVKQTGKITDNFGFASDARNLAAFLLLLKAEHSQSYKQIVDAIRLVAPFFEDFVLRPTPGNRETISLTWLQRGTDEPFGASDFSDGTLRFICLATALLQPSPPSTILLDEPELGLHPYAITLLASLMRSASTRMQVIVSTQSVPLINQFSPTEIIVVDRESSESTFKRLQPGDLSSWLDDYGMGDLWEKNVLGGRPTHA